MTDVKFRDFLPGGRDWLIAQHPAHDARKEGFDARFGLLVADIIDAFLDQHDRQPEQGWIAPSGKQRLGSVCVRLGETTAKLRLFLLTPPARGTGLGQRMLETCMGSAGEGVSRHASVGPRIPPRFTPKTGDLGEKRDLPDDVFGWDKPSQPVVITGKGSVFGGWYVGRFRSSTGNHFDHTF